MTSGSDALLVLYNGLDPEEQNDAYERVTAQRLSADAATEDDMARYLRSLRRVTEHLGHFPKTMEYKAAALELIEQGEDVETFARVYARFGSWHRAREAVGMAEVSSPLRVESRFKQRRHGRPYRFTNAQLVETMERAVADLGGVPTTSDFTWWRRSQLEQANARGDHDHALPALSAYRRRWGTWRGALAGCGYTEQQIFDRLGSVTGPPSLWVRTATTSMPRTLPVAELNGNADIAGGLSASQTDKLRAAWLQLPHRSRHVITVRLGA